MEQEQFKKEVVPLREKLWGCARRVLDNPQDVEDVVQEVFLKLWNIREELDRYDSVEALSVQITKNICLNKLRRIQTHTEVPLTDTTVRSCEAVTPYNALEQKDEMDRILFVLKQLPPLQQSILQMKHVDGLEVKEIAELTGSTPENVRVILSRARKRVKEIFLKTM